jgi:hypothetical protein
MLADSTEENRIGGRVLRARASSVDLKTNGTRITMWEQQQRQASPEFGLVPLASLFWLMGTPEISQVAGENTSHATNSSPVRRRMVIAAIRKIVTREGIPCS